MRKHITNALIGILTASLFLFLTFRDRQFDDIIRLLQSTSTRWILVTVLLLVVVFFLRSLRWKLLLENTGNKTGFKDVSYSLLLGIFINSFTPKLGEIIRCTSLEKHSGIATSKSFGTVVSERIYDLMALFAGVLIIIIIEFDRLNTLLEKSFRSLFESIINNITLLTIISVTTILLVILTRYLMIRHKFAGKIGSFLKGIASTAKMTFKIKNSRNFTIQTILIWFVMVLMNYACLKALPSTGDMSLYFAMVALFIGTIGWAIPSPGGIGTSHFFILQLFILYNLGEETGIAYGILVNGITVLFTIVVGLIAIILFKITRYRNYNNHHSI